MPRQKSHLKITGTIDDLTYYHSPHGYLIRKTARHDPEKVRTLPSFQRTRENASEFGQVTKTAAHLRALMGEPFLKCGDMSFTSRLISILHKVMKSDPQSVKGERTVTLGLQDPAGQQLLTGFELHREKKLSDILQQKIHADAATGTIHIPSYSSLKWPPSATHIKWTSAWIRPDPNREEGHVIITHTEPIALTATPTPLELNPATPLPGSGTTILLLHIQFFTKQGTELLALQENRCAQALAVRG
ncbi:MAG: hypothetical protein KA479_04360 [Saprospiraceae bacterium]|nr:hypothetical protein [Saprospiraceae bacterium]